MRRRALSLIRVRTKPGSPTRGILLAGPRAMPVVLGRGGIRANKFEGDGATPRGRFRLVRLWWRADRPPHDQLYDFIIEIDHNTRPRIAGRGSAVFVHLARPNRSPTAGCVALAPKDLQRLLAALGPQTRIAVEL
ncbi:MAG: hypothetical protein AUI16_02215 [Alphaproteobacteria bacterium 13_2_20CM_2_64_7]|nr:MAG: hypothetical protein AUI16_02215 [Alphaproteobacteria bacterium 13_2_20CM_2_64_7]